MVDQVKKVMQNHLAAMNEPIDEAQVKMIQREQQELLDAFRARHGLDPDNVGIEVRNCGDGRVVWSVRKLSVAEREWRQQQALRKDAAAMAGVESGKVHVYAYATGLDWKAKILFWMRRTFSPGAVFLSERGARQEGGPNAQVYKLEVRA
jgi:hypothetical protein